MSTTSTTATNCSCIWAGCECGRLNVSHRYTARYMALQFTTRNKNQIATTKRLKRLILHKLINFLVVGKQKQPKTDIKPSTIRVGIGIGNCELRTGWLIFIFSKATNYGSNFQAQFAEKNMQQANALGKHMENYSNKYLPGQNWAKGTETETGPRDRKRRHAAKGGMQGIAAKSEEKR